MMSGPAGLNTEKLPKVLTALDVRKALTAARDPEKVTSHERFFKTKPGGYAQNDQFIGVTVPTQRKIAKQFGAMPLSEVQKLLTSKIHEERLTALLIMVKQFEHGDPLQKKSIVDSYLKHIAYVNNWDLVDSSAPYILGPWLLNKDRRILDRLAKSKRLFERRIAIISTYAFIRAGDASDTLRLAELLLSDEEDLMHKAVGWMLREVEKRVDVELLRNFLETNVARMPRTTLRYAIEHLKERERKKWLGRE
jgi:3-methyladenine DNA glycosylase AlkD